PSQSCSLRAASGNPIRCESSSTCCDSSTVKPDTLSQIGRASPLHQLHKSHMGLPNASGSDCSCMARLSLARSGVEGTSPGSSGPLYHTGCCCVYPWHGFRGVRSKLAKPLGKPVLNWFATRHGPRADVGEESPTGF